MNSSRGMIATRHGPSASTFSGSGLSVIAAIAPIQVGAKLADIGSVRPSMRLGGLRRALEQQQRPGRGDALLEQQLVVGARRGSR